MSARNDAVALPRLFVNVPLETGNPLALSAEQTHYLKSVLRRPDGSALILFNGKNGEWQATFTFAGKRDGTAIPQHMRRPQPPEATPLHLAFCPIRKERLDFLIEKAVELGVSDLHPVLSQRTVVRDLNRERIHCQIVEASEQCERLDVPMLHPLRSLSSLMGEWPSAVPLYVALERDGAPTLISIPRPKAASGLLIGPEGGFTEEEKSWLKTCPSINPVSLGPRILRSETAALVGLGFLSGLS